MAGKVCQQGGTEAVGRRCRPKLSVQAGGFAQDTFFVIFQAEMSGQFMATVPSSPLNRDAGTPAGSGSSGRTERISANRDSGTTGRKQPHPAP